MTRTHPKACAPCHHHSYSDMQTYNANTSLYYFHPIQYRQIICTLGALVIRPFQFLPSDLASPLDRVVASSGQSTTTLQQNHNTELYCWPSAHLIRPAVQKAVTCSPPDRGYALNMRHTQYRQSASVNRATRMPACRLTRHDSDSRPHRA